MTFVIWMTGLPCSGKSTLARKLSEKIPNMEILDGDEIRQWFSSTDFSKKGISENNKRAAYIAKLLLKHQIPVCVALVSPYNDDRKIAQSIIGNEKFILTYLKCSAQICEQRDVKGMYKKAKSGLLENFLGIDNRYEIPENPNLVIETESLSIDESIDKILSYLCSHQLLKN
jgi:adenylylsulfate kinase